MLNLKKLAPSVLGSMILAFGLYHIHSTGVITEGGILGLSLLLHHWFHISPAVSGFVLNGICYLLGFRVLGKSFLAYSAISSGAFSLFYAFFEHFPLLFPSLADHPFIAAVTGAIFVGAGIGLCVCAGGAPGGDDTLAMTINHISGWSIEMIYLISDLTVLLLSLSYIPFEKIIYSLITVILSGQIIGYLQRSTLCKKIHG